MDLVRLPCLAEGAYSGAFRCYRYLSKPRIRVVAEEGAKGKIGVMVSALETTV